MDDAKKQNEKVFSFLEKKVYENVQSWVFCFAFCKNVYIGL
jgi:hypothetical protein